MFPLCNENGETADEADFCLSYAQDEEKIRSAVTKYAPDASISFRENNYVYVFLDLYVDETLVTTGTELVRNIYQELDFLGCRYETIGFILITEDNGHRERARIFFDKDFYEVKITARGIFRNGRLNKYRQDFLDTLNCDAFYASLVERFDTVFNLNDLSLN